MRRMISIMVVAAMAVLMPSCSTYSPEPGGPNDLTGTWSIIMSSQYTGFSYGLTATLTQSGDNVTGTIQCVRASNTCDNAPTTVTSASVSGANVNFEFATSCGGATGTTQTV